MGSRGGRPRKGTKTAQRELRDRLRELSAAKGWQQKEMAEACHVSAATVSGWFNSRQPRLPSAANLQALAQASGYSLDWLLLGPPIPEIRGDTAPIGDIAETLRTHVGLQLLAAGAMSDYERPYLPDAKEMIDDAVKSAGFRMAKLRFAVGLELGKNGRERSGQPSVAASGRR